MAYAQRDNSGSLFRNEKKDAEHPTWCDYRGSISVDGREYWLSAWLKTAKTGQKYMSLSIKPKDAPQKVGLAPTARVPDVFPDDDVPF